MTSFKQLAGLALSHRYCSEKKKFEWAFKVEVLDAVTGHIAKPITFEQSESQVKKIVELCPPIYKKVPSSRWKGIGEYTFIEKPNIFLCGEWQKNSQGIPTQGWTKVPKQNVIDIWNLIKKYPLNKAVKGKTIAENLCADKGYTRFFREDSGTFDWQKAWGSHREWWMPFCYWPFKILDKLGVASYTKRGTIARTKDELVFQTQFKVTDYD